MRHIYPATKSHICHTKKTFPIYRYFNLENNVFIGVVYSQCFIQIERALCSNILRIPCILMKQGNRQFLGSLLRKIDCIDTRELVIYYENLMIVLSRGSAEKKQNWSRKSFFAS
jgi:hypothetical protein